MKLPRHLRFCLVFCVALDVLASLAFPRAVAIGGAASVPSYEFTRHGEASSGTPHDAAYAARNSAQTFRAYFGDEGVRIIPGLVGKPGWSLDLRPVVLGTAETVFEASHPFFPRNLPKAVYT